MEKLLHNETEQVLWQAPVWYRALSLTERLASRQAEPGAISSNTGETVDQAVRRLRAWKAQPPFDQGTLFAERLARSSLSEKDLLALLAEPPARRRTIF